MRSSRKRRNYYRLEFDNVDIWMDEEDWREFKNLTKEFAK